MQPDHIARIKTPDVLDFPLYPSPLFKLALNEGLLFSRVALGGIRRLSFILFAQLHVLTRQAVPETAQTVTEALGSLFCLPDPSFILRRL